jgi:hypothetical protein
MTLSDNWGVEEPREGAHEAEMIVKTGLHLRVFESLCTMQMEEGDTSWCSKDVVMVL